MLRRVKSVQLEREVPVIVQNTADEMVRLNRSQLYKGVNVEGNKLTPYQSPLYALEKNRTNPAPGLFNPDLFVTGAFYRGFYAQVKAGKSVIFGSTDVKSEALEEKYGKLIFGLTKDNKRVYLDTTVWPMIRAYVSRQTGLRFT